MKILCLALALACCGHAAQAQERMNGAMPDASRQHHQRSNCHGAYDLLVERFKAGRPLADDEQAFVNAYEANAEAGSPCPEPGPALRQAAVNRVVVSQEAFYQLTRYVQQPDPEAFLELGYSTAMGNAPPDVDRALGVETLREAANLGHPHAHYILGQAYASGALGQPDMAAALRHHTAAAEGGHVDGMFMTGLFTASGTGTRADGAKGLAWLRKAAEAGHVHATYSAAGMVLMGQGVKQDLDLAYRLGRNLVDHGEVVGAAIIASALLQRRDVRKHEAEVLHYMDMATRHGDEKIRADMEKFRPQVADIYKRMKERPVYQPPERKVCGTKTVCYVNRYTGNRDCSTNVDYWSDCNTLPD